MMRFILPGLLMLLMVGCSSTSTEEGEEISLRQGETYTIMLEENPTTGYQWRVFLLDLRVISIQDNEFIAPGVVMPGAPGQRKMVIKGDKVGRGELELHYIRSWETDQKPADKKLYVFKVYPKQP